MPKRKIEISDYANEIIKALPKGVLLTSKADKVNSMVIGWGTLGINWSRPVIAVYVREGRYTKGQLDKNPERQGYRQDQGSWAYHSRFGRNFGSSY